MSEQASSAGIGSDYRSLSQSLEFEAFAGDPLGRIVLGRLRATPLALALASLAAVGLASGLSLLIFTLSLPSATANDFLSPEDWAIAILWVFVVPILAAFYGWISTESGRLFAHLYRAGVFEADEVALHDTVVGDSDTLQSVHAWAGWAVAGGFVSLSAFLTVVLLGVVRGNWPAENWEGNIPVLALIFVGYFIVCMIASRQLSTIVCLWRIFHRHTLRLRPFHPDQCGGLSALSKFAISFGYFLALAGFGLALGGIQSQIEGHFANDYPLHFGLGAYAILAPLTFFGTLGAAHSAMADAKTRWLAWISNQFDEDYTTVVGALDQDAGAFSAQVAKVNHLHSLYRLTQAFPVWPFDTATVSRFAGILAAPLLTVAATAVVNAVITYA